MNFKKTDGSFKKGNRPWNAGKRSAKIKSYRCITVNGVQKREHRHVMEKHLGRKLRPGEVIHHKNGDITDNRVENLELISAQSEHMRSHMTKEKAQLMAAKQAWMRNIERRVDRLEKLLGDLDIIDSSPTIP